MNKIKSSMLVTLRFWMAVILVGLGLLLAAAFGNGMNTYTGKIDFGASLNFVPVLFGMLFTSFLGALINIAVIVVSIGILIAIGVGVRYLTKNDKWVTILVILVAVAVFGAVFGLSWALAPLSWISTSAFALIATIMFAVALTWGTLTIAKPMLKRK